MIDEPPIIEPVDQSRSTSLTIWYFVSIFAAFTLLVPLFYPRMFADFVNFDFPQLRAKTLIRSIALVVYSVNLGTLFYLGKWILGKGNRFPTLTGHWLCLFIPAMRLLPMIENRLLVKYLDPQSVYENVKATPIVILVRYLTLMLFWIALLVINRRAGYWRFFFLASSLYCLGMVGFGAWQYSIQRDLLDIESMNRYYTEHRIYHDTLGFFIKWVPIAIALLGLLFIVLDFRNRAKLDWLHWIGVGSLVVFGILELVSKYFYSVNQYF
jgi:hypothetical protein